MENRTFIHARKARQQYILRLYCSKAAVIDAKKILSGFWYTVPAVAWSPSPYIVCNAHVIEAWNEGQSSQEREGDFLQASTI